jgi:formylglycine-generating enzyme required for sulfatase activity
LVNFQISENAILAAKILISYRQEDAKDQAARLRDRLASRDAFGGANVFIDVDHLLAGQQRFDEELEKELASTDVLLAVIGPRWAEIHAARAARGERDHVREEIARALACGIVVIPVLVGHASLPHARDLPEDIRDLLIHHKHDVVDESFGRDTDALIRHIKLVLKGPPKPAPAAMPWKGLAAFMIVVVGLSAYFPPPARTQQPVLPAAEGLKSAQAKAPVDSCDGILVAVGLSGEKTCIKPGSGQSFKDCPECPEMVVVPAGSFTMGSPESEPERESPESPQHEITISKPFAVGQTHITRGEFEHFVKAMGHKADGGCYARTGTTTGSLWQGSKPNLSWRSTGFEQDDSHPAICVNWNDAKAYVSWLSNTTGQAYRLMSEAEAEYTARAGTTTPFWEGSSITPQQANFNGNYVYFGGEKGEFRQKTLPVKSFKPNAWGLYQVHGNAYTWVEDCWHDNYNGAPSDGSAWTTRDCELRVLRGGSWFCILRFLRAANRLDFAPSFRLNAVGFRVARTITP